MSFSSSICESILEVSPQNDESIKSDNNFTINILSDELFYNINKMSKANYTNNSFYSNDSEISKSSIQDDLLEYTEQINEVKYNFFMIINNDCSYDGRYNDILEIKKRNELKCKRLVIQKMTIEDKVIYDKKDYIFFPIKSNNNSIKFDYTIGTQKKNFEILLEKKACIIICDGQKLKQEEIFEQSFPQIKAELQKEKKSKQNTCSKIKDKNENKSEGHCKENIDNKPKIIDTNNKTKDNITNNIIKQNKNEKKTYSSLIDSDSENEVKQKETFYINQEKNIFYRFSFCNYTKEMDGIYTTNKEIDLKIEGKINLEYSMKKLINGEYKIDNELKSYIIYKNFDSSKIEKNTPMFLEIKKSFVLFDLLTQIKKSVKIINHLKLDNKETELPHLIIGIMFNYDSEGANALLNKLNEKYKDEEISILQHNLEIINENNEIKVLIGVIKDGKINKYPLNIEDYEIDDNQTKSDYRVDLKSLNKMAFEKPFGDSKIDEIFDSYKTKYKSLEQKKGLFLTISQFSQLSSSNEENKELKEKINKMEKTIKENEEEKKKMEKTIKEKEEEKIKMNEKLKNEEEEKIYLLELLGQYYKPEELQKILKEKKEKKLKD